MLTVLLAILFPQSGYTTGTDSFRFKQRGFRSLKVTPDSINKLNRTPAEKWLEATVESTTNLVQVSAQLVVHGESADSLRQLLRQHPWKVLRQIAPNVVLLDCANPVTALKEAEIISSLPGVEAAYPMTRRNIRQQGPYAAPSNDPYFNFQWNMERRNTDGSSSGGDMNVRASWPFTTGEGVIVGVADDGIDFLHPDLTNRLIGMPHFNFYAGNTNGAAFSAADRHGTAVSGLIAASRNNNRGMIGVAPGAGLASWKIFNGSVFAVLPDQLFDMFQYKSNVVQVQNHSWGFGGAFMDGPTPLEDMAISNAVTFGRNGLGVVYVRAAGNDRLDGGDANADGYPNNPSVIAVGAVRFDGRVASYSVPGACVLVAAPSGDTGFQTLFTTDRVGLLGFNFLTYTSDLADYGFDGSGATGTSFSSPQVAGVVALILSANPALSYRDVQQILIVSSRHFDLADPTIETNGVGYRVSHNVGFGIPDAGQAVNIARRWTNRPAATSISIVASNTAAIPDDGLRVIIPGAPGGIASIPASPSLGLHPDAGTATLPLVDIGLANGVITTNLSGRGALIQRGINNFSDKIQRAADAGAAFAVIFNNTGTTERIIMGETDFSPIPAVFIGKTAGDALRTYLQSGGAQARLQLFPTNYLFQVSQSLLCEHVTVRVKTDHPSRADVRITLVSPMGTRSVLQRVNNEFAPGPIDWTYSSVHHFFEEAAGTWRLEVSDEGAGSTGNVTFAELTVFGTPILDVDGNGLHDPWERSYFGKLGNDPKADPDHDGYSNAQELILHTDPLHSDIPLQLDLSNWTPQIQRLSWPGSTNFQYRVHFGPDVANLSGVTNIPGRFPETEWFVPITNGTQKFFRLEAVPLP